MGLVFDYSWEEPNESDSWCLYTPVRQRNKTKPAEYWDGQVYKGLLHRRASDFYINTRIIHLTSSVSRKDFIESFLKEWRGPWQ